MTAVEATSENGEIFEVTSHPNQEETFTLNFRTLEDVPREINFKFSFAEEQWDCTDLSRFPSKYN